MNILHTVEFYDPSVGGAQEVVKQLSEQMVNKGHSVTVATTKIPGRKKQVNGVKIVEFAISGNKVRGFSGETERYKRYLTESDFDVVLNYAAQQWATDLFFEVMDEVKSKKLIVPCGYSALYDPAYKRYFEELPTILKKYDASIYLSHNYRDIHFAHKHGVKNLHVIPNAASEDKFENILEKETAKFRDRFGIRGKMVLTVGNHTGEKGHIECLKAFTLSPVTNTTLVIVGGGRPDEGCYDSCHKWTRKLNTYLRWLKKKIVLLPTPEAVMAFKAADLFLFLSKIEASPLVLFEANAAKTPFLATDVGNSKEIAKWTKGGQITKTIQDANGRVSASVASAAFDLWRLLNNPRRLKAMTKTGRKAWKKNFTWSKIADKYLSLYREVRE